MLQDPEIHPVKRVSHEAVPRNDGARLRASRAQSGTIAAAVGGCDALTRSEEIQAAQLQAASHIPDAVGDGAVALVRDAQRVPSSEILDQVDLWGRRRGTVPEGREACTFLKVATAD